MHCHQEHHEYRAIISHTASAFCCCLRIHTVKTSAQLSCGGPGRKIKHHLNKSLAAALQAPRQRKKCCHGLGGGYARAQWF